MRFIKILFQIAILYLFSKIGGGIAEFFHLPVPGSLLGMVLLFTVLSLGIFRPEWISVGAESLLRYLPIFFVPTTVGVITYPSLLSWEGLKIFVILIVTTVLMLSAAGKIASLTSRGGRSHG
jgi:holin-like protein